MEESRDKSIDIIRGIGLLLIILAHVNPPFVILQTRCFDVPLMLFVSGLSSSGKTISNYWEYIWRRSKRLLVPTYLFLTVYLFFLYLFQSLFAHNQVFVDWRIVFESYKMTGGIGYLWIIRVFFLIMLITPFLLKITKQLNNRSSLLLVLLAVGLATLIAWYSCHYIVSPSIKCLFNDWLSNIIGYSAPFVMGLAIRNSNKAERFFYLFSLLVVVCVALSFYIVHNGFPIRLSPEYKYPPQSYYLIYGLFASCLLWCLKGPITRLLGTNTFLFIGRNTIWIYLYHIPSVLFVGFISNNWIVKYLLVLFVSISCTYNQYMLSQKYKSRFSICKYLIG